MTQPAEFCRNNFSMEKGKDYDQDIKFLKGTTTLAFKVSAVFLPIISLLLTFECASLIME